MVAHGMRQNVMENGYDSGAGTMPLGAPLTSTITGFKTLLQSLGQHPPLGCIFSLSDHDGCVGLAKVSRVFRVDDEDDNPLPVA